jgi:hypothetical protein
MMSKEMTATAIELLQAQKHGKNITLSDVLTICRARNIDPDPVVLVVLRMVRDLGVAIRRVPVTDDRWDAGIEQVCWHKDTYHELPLDHRSAVVLDSPELVDAMGLYNEVTGGKFTPAKPEDHFPKFIPRPRGR